jgi:hypothetical protein
MLSNASRARELDIGLTKEDMMSISIQEILT